VSAIFGLYWTAGRPAERDDLERMSLSLTHRGADGASVWTRGSVGLGHRPLRTTPESAEETQPLTGGSEQLILTADARLDNREELIRLLDLPRRTGRVTDGELILGAYARWGEACVERLLGDFAFAVWDATRRALFCARDHAGIKPFCYRRWRDGFAFASEIGPLLQVFGPSRLNEEKIADHARPEPRARSTGVASPPGSWSTAWRCWTARPLPRAWR